MIPFSRTSSDPGSMRASDSENGNGGTTNTSTTTTMSKLKKDPKFWLIFASMCLCLFLSALELSSVSTALPTIAHELRASQFVWVGSAYVLSSTAFLPMSGGLAQAFGRRPAILFAIGLFAFGSGICGGANSMNMLIAGRTIQGLGGGGVQSLTGIILADLVTLQERGMYAGLYGLTWCLAASIGPLVGGSLAAQGKWRWLFYLNLPIALVACLSVLLCLDLPTPPGSFKNKFRQLDWIGNNFIVGSTVACAIALTWGGTTASWTSVAVLVPFVFGIIGLVAFVVYEVAFATHPLVPLALMTNATCISGYVQTFCIALNSIAIIYFFPVYFQACKGVSPVLSGIYILSLCTFAPAAILAGLSVKATGRYRPQIWTAWMITLVTMSLLGVSTDMGIGESLGYLALLGLGTGVLYATTVYPIQAPMSVTQNAPALAWMWFLRSFASVWGITIGSAVLQNELARVVPPSVFQSVPEGALGLYALIPALSALPPPVRSEVQLAFATSLAVLWRVLTAVCAVGGIASLFMRGLPLSHALDPTWAIDGTSVDKEDKEAVPARELEMNQGPCVTSSIP